MDHVGKGPHCRTHFLLLLLSIPSLRVVLSSHAVDRDREVNDIQRMDKDLRQREQKMKRKKDEVQNSSREMKERKYARSPEKDK